MSYKSILLFIDPNSNSTAAEDLAVSMAQEYDAHLTALVPTFQPSIPYYTHHPLLADVLDAQLDAARKEAEQTARTFAKDAEQNGIAAECRVETCYPGTAAELVATHARYNDLVIMTQPDPDDPGPAGRHLPEDVLLAGGSAVLMVPYIGTQRPPGKKVLIAWDAGREAARAIREALPILKKAEEVTLLTIEPKGGPSGHGEEPGADVAQYLARHGCHVTVEVIRDISISVEDTILSFVGDRDLDLLVMGAYGHSRLREIALGGVTQGILEHMTIPTLAAH